MDKSIRKMWAILTLLANVQTSIFVWPIVCKRPCLVTWPHLMITLVEKASPLLKVPAVARFIKPYILYYIMIKPYKIYTS
jgi:hypothetical protein